jgi:tetratricopeptide (TPR) repeat protein
MKRKYFVSLFCTAIFLCFGAVQAQAATLEKQLRATERLLTEAEATLERGEKDHAIQLYGATITAYEEVGRRFPEEETALIQFRINYCRNQLMHLLREKRLPPTESTAQPTKPIPARAPLPDALRTAIVHCRMGQFAQGRKVVEQHLSSYPEDAVAHLIASTAKLGLGQREEAISGLRTALELDETLADAHYNLAQLLLRNLEPDFDGARKHYQRSIELGGARDNDIEVVIEP